MPDLIDEILSAWSATLPYKIREELPVNRE